MLAQIESRPASAISQFDMQILTAVPDPTIVFDSALEAVFCNRAFEAFDEAGLALSALRASAEIQTLVQQVIETNTAQATPTVTIAVGGAMRSLQVSGSPLNPTGNDAACICFIRDITEVQQREHDLAESRNLLQLVLEHLPVRVFWKDNDLRYMGCNTVFAEDMGFEHPQELIGHDDYHTKMTREEATICREDDFSVLESGEGCYGSEEVISDGDNKSWIRVSKVPLHNAQGEMIGVLGMYEGIDEQKQAQLELEHALRREKTLNEMKSRFISTVSHEYRNPLATILATSEALIHIGDRFDAAKRQLRLEKIVGAVHRMTKLMDDVLFIGRDGITDAPQRYEAIDVVALSQSVIETLAATPDHAGRVRLMEIGDARPLIASRMHLGQMLNNLLENGLKYSAEPVNLHINWQPTTLCLTIQDSGIGMSPKCMERAYDSFYRGENVGMVEGSGLGLYIVKHVVELHNGSINIDSKQDQGTVVTVQVPYRPNAVEFPDSVEDATV